VSIDDLAAVRDQFAANARAEDAVWDEPAPNADKDNAFIVANDTLVSEWAVRDISKNSSLLCSLMTNG
jgi:hypothetical protein